MWTQPHLFDPGPLSPRQFDVPQVAQDDGPYLHALEWNEDNPIYGQGPAPPGSTWEGERGSDEEQFIPTADISSSQRRIKRENVDQLVRNATGREVPPIWVNEYETEGGPRYRLDDGNHRVNAALERGQMLIPARIQYRYWRVGDVEVP